MNVQSTHEKSVRKYILAIAVFIAVVALCLAVFFGSLFAYVEHAVEREIGETMEHQISHIDFSFSVRFQHLESAADFLGKQDDIHGEIARQYIQSLSENSSMQHVAIYDANSNAIFENGDSFEDVDPEYIHLALQGQRSVSDPAQSLIDGVTRFYLSVPIRRGSEIVGVLSGSFNIEQLGSLLLKDYYEGQSVLFIADLNGQIVYATTPSSATSLSIPKDLYSQLRQSAILKGETAEELIAKIERHESGMAQYQPTSGSQLFLLYAPITDSNLMLMHAIPRDVAYSEFHFIETSVIVVGVVLLSCVLLLVLFLVFDSTHSQRSLVRFAQLDPLTELYNRQYTQEAIDSWLKSDACTGTQAMLFIDIDYFKQINDQYGHNIGDDALRFVSQTLRQEFRSSDIIGRIGGDEFVVFMRNVPVKQAVRAHAAALHTRMMNADIPELDKGMLHCSIGIAYAPEHGKTYHDLTLCADKALYQTKEHGRDGFTEYMTNGKN